DPGPVSNYFPALFQSFNPSYIHTDRRIKFQCPSAGGNLRIAEHNAYFLTKLVDKDHNAVGLAYMGGELPECLGHKPCLKPHMCVSRICLYLRFGNKRRY